MKYAGLGNQLLLIKISSAHRGRVYDAPRYKYTVARLTVSASHQRVVAHRTGSTQECFLERLKEDFFEHQSRLEAIQDQVVAGPAETLYTWNVNLTDHQVSPASSRW